MERAGNIYVTGYTGASDFPTTSAAFDTSYNGGDRDAFVIKLNASGTRLIYATLLGGSGYDYGLAIAVDGADSAFVTGGTGSSNFPTTPGAFDTSRNGGDAFVVKLNAEGSGLAYATFLGGREYDDTLDIALDGAGNAYVTGYTGSSNFPTTAGAFDTTYNGGKYDAFVVKVNAAGTWVIYGTFLGSSGWDEGTEIVVDREDKAYVAGESVAVDLPTKSGGLVTAYNGGGTRGGCRARCSPHRRFNRTPATRSP